MENNDPKNSKSNAPGDLEPSTTAKKQPNSNTKKAKRGNQKPANKKRKTLRESWRSSTRFKQLEIVLLVLTAATGIGFLGVYVWGNLQTKWNFWAEHKPLVIHDRAPDFLGTFACAVNSGFQVGNIDKFYKNIGNRTAEDVVALLSDSRVIPEKRTGNPFWDTRLSISSKDCESPLSLRGAPLEPGVEQVVHQRQAVVSLPPQVSSGDLVQYEMKTCTFYSDENGGKHGTCDIYQLRTKDAKLASVDKLLGTPSLPCDGVERTAHFVQEIGGHCQQ